MAPVQSYSMRRTDMTAAEIRTSLAVVESDFEKIVSSYGNPARRDLADVDMDGLDLALEKLSLLAGQSVVVEQLNRPLRARSVTSLYSRIDALEERIFIYLASQGPE